MDGGQGSKSNKKAKGMTDCQQKKIKELWQYIKNGEIKAKRNFMFYLHEFIGYLTDVLPSIRNFMFYLHELMLIKYVICLESSCCPQCKSTIIEKDQKTRLESCIFCSDGVPFPKDDKDMLEDRDANEGKNKANKGKNKANKGKNKANKGKKNKGKR
ncbi:hypothetical protein LINGRAHAP2_LOCUS21971 [Linum grandiflorum]